MIFLDPRPDGDTMTDILQRVRRAQKALGYRVVREAGDEIERLREEIGRLRKGIQDYLDGNDGPRRLEKTDECPHGKFQWERCDVCIDLYFHRLLTATLLDEDEG